MRSEWNPEELISCWTLDEADWRLLANKTGATRLGFAVLLKFLELEGRFPADAAEVPTAALDYLAGQVKADPAELEGYWSGRAVKYHRARIRVELGFREATLEDERRMGEWLAGELCPVELDERRLREDLLARLREERIEPPGESRVERILGSGQALFERQFTNSIVERLSALSVDALERLVPPVVDGEVATAGLLVELKSDPGPASLNTILEEIDKLERVRALGLPADLFADCSEKLLGAWRARAAAAYPSDPAIRLTLLAALCWSRTAEITDALVGLLVDVVDKIQVRAENRVEKALVADLKKVRGKHGLLLWRNPDEDLPADFAANRDVHYAAIRKPRDPRAFVSDLQARLHAGLERLDQAVSTNTAAGVWVTTRRGRPWIVVPAIGRLPDPPNIQALHGEIQRRHGMLDLLGVLKHADYLSDFTAQLTSVASREITDPVTARRRKLLVTFGIGSNIGIKRIAEATDGHPADTEAALRRFRRLYFTRDGLRRAIIELVNTTLHVRDTMLWGEGTTCTSDSKQFGSWDSNLMTEWHNRYGGPGVMVYWHVEKKQLCIHSQLTTCSASEVAAMLRGLLHHDTDVEIEANITDTHGASIVGFGFCELLGFKLMPRFKQIGRIPLRPGPAHRRGLGSDRAGDLRAADQLGSDRPAVRRVGQVRDRAEARHRRSPTAPSTVHARRAQAPRPSGDGRARPRRPHDLPLRLPRRGGCPPPGS